MVVLEKKKWSNLWVNKNAVRFYALLQFFIIFSGLYYIRISPQLLKAFTKITMQQNWTMISKYLSTREIYACKFYVSLYLNIEHFERVETCICSFKNNQQRYSIYFFFVNYSSLEKDFTSSRRNVICVSLWQLISQRPLWLYLRQLMKSFNAVIDQKLTLELLFMDDIFVCKKSLNKHIVLSWL